MIQGLPKDIPFAKVEEKDLEYWKKSYKDMFERACEYKNEITNLKDKIRKMEEAEEKFFEFMKTYVMSKSEYKDLEGILLTKENKLEFLVSILK